MLTRDVTKEEIFLTLNSFPPDKSLGADGFNSEFYKFFEEDIGDHFCSAIKNFFQSASMPRAGIKLMWS